MKQTNPQKILLVITIALFANVSVWGQASTYNKPRCAKYKPQAKTEITKPVAQKEIKIELPKDYKPPVAKNEHYQFPETFAQKKQLKQLRKRHKKKKKGCIAAAM